MKTLLGVAILAASVAANASPAAADRAHDLAAQAGAAQRRTCENVTTLAACHPSHPTGCSHSASPQYDAYLNFLKNQVPAPDTGISRYITRSRITSLDTHTPSDTTSRNHATLATTLADLGEGNIVALIGYLYFVQNTGAETTNCQLDGDGETDFHIGVGFNRAIAQGLQDGHTPDDVEMRRLQQTSIVVEMTPHYRAQHRPQWTDTLLRRFVGRQVKVVGQLMLDNEHARPRDNCAAPDADTDRCWRATAWEIHPVTRFYVCTTAAACSRNSSAWRPVEELE